MVRRLQLLFIALCSVSVLYGQDYLTVPRSNPGIFQETQQVENQKLQVFEDNFIYLYDTLDLPFIDDFSKNHQRKRIRDLTDTNLTDSVLYKLIVGGRPFPDTIGFTRDTTYKFVLNSSGDTILAEASFAIPILFCDLSQAPIQYLPYDAFPAYNYTEQAGVFKDTVFVDAEFEQDSVVFYTVPPNGKDLWTDASAYINRTFGLNPPSIGVATFDGLNELGLPYDFDNPLRVLADFLTSAPLRMGSLPDTNVYLSFFYQPKGIALDRPEADDSLIVDFYNPATGKWSGAWNSPGFSADTFSQVILKVPSQFHLDGFRFRFKNYANSTGAFDQWHIDYVYLNHDRTATQEFYNDIAYIYDAPSMLKDHYAMPSWHYKNDPASYTIDTAVTFMRNATNIDNLPVYNFVTIPDTTTNTNFFSFPPDPSSFSRIPANVVQRFEYPIPNELFPADKVDTAGVFESIFSVEFRPKTDIITSNDTVISRTVLKDYYAYDDGTAEAGYGVNPALSADGLTAFMAIRYNIPFADTLKGIQTYFLPQAVDVSKQRIFISVWSSVSPPVKLYEREASARPTYSEPNGIVTFSLDTALVVDQTFFIGFKTVGANSINIGYDLNTNHKNKLFFSQNGLVWSAASSGIRDGALMLRPIFRNRVFDVRVEEEKLQNNDLAVYPNPTIGLLNLKMLKEQQLQSIALFNITGKLVLDIPFKNQIDLSSLSKGMYFLKVQNNKGEQLTRKVILSD